MMHNRKAIFFSKNKKITIIVSPYLDSNPAPPNITKMPVPNIPKQDSNTVRTEDWHTKTSFWKTVMIPNKARTPLPSSRLSKPVPKDKVEEPKFNCQTCGLTLSTKSALISHEKMHKRAAEEARCQNLCGKCCTVFGK